MSPDHTLGGSQLQIMFKRRADLAGMRFGMLVAISIDRSVPGASRWLCVCDCGTKTIKLSANLVSGKTRSCGCLKPVAFNGPGGAKGIGPARKQAIGYNCWKAMVMRCTNPRSDSYYLYGARGIRVCERWRSSFDSFLADMGPRPTTNHSIDRINNDGHYEPGNCRWATPVEQNANMRHTRRIQCGGLTKTIREWAEFTGIDRFKLKYQIEKGKRPLEEILKLI